MEQNKLFRKAALEKLASPERLDVLMQVTSPLGWLALLTMASILCAIVAWSIFGSMSEIITGQGILLGGGGLREIKANGEGVLENLTLNLNESVKEGQVVGTVTEGAGEDAIRAAQTEFEQASREAQNSRLANAATIAGIHSNIAEQEAEIARTNGDLERSRAEVARLDDMLRQGLTTRSRLQAAESEVRTHEARLTAQRATINNFNSQIRSYELQTRQAEQRVEAAKTRLASTRRGVVRSTQILASAAGRVIEVNKKTGDRVKPGETVARIEPPGAQIEAIVFVDAATGKRIAAARQAQISPSTVKREEYGFMIGTVQSVSDFPVTAERFNSIISNQSLFQDLIGESAKLEMRTALEADPTTASGFKWSSSTGPPFKVSSGTRVSVSVVVEQKRPISKVLPFVRKTLGTS
jgi:HlyD family secretion protein